MVIDVGAATACEIAPASRRGSPMRAATTRRSSRQELANSRSISARRPSAQELDHEVVDALGADVHRGRFLRLGDLALAGRAGRAAEELARLSPGGSEAIPIVRALQRRLLKLAPMRARIERGERVDAVMTSMGKALFWKDKALIERLLAGGMPSGLAQVETRAALERQLMSQRPLRRGAGRGTGGDCPRGARGVSS